MLSLIGVVMIIIGFILKLDTIAVVLVSGVVTGLVGGLSFVEILDIVGTSFVANRYMSLFLVTLPVIGVLERYGLREQAATAIKKMKMATTGSVLGAYHLVREIAAALSLRLGGHVQFIRPLVNPMAYGAAEKRYGKVDEKSEELIKGYAAMTENLGNFFGQNMFVAAGGVLLIVGTLKEQGIEILPIDVAKASIPIGVVSFLLAVIQYYFLDRRLARLLGSAHEAKGAAK